MEAVSELFSVRERGTVKNRGEAVPKLFSWQEKVTARNMMQSRVRPGEVTSRLCCMGLC